MDIVINVLADAARGALSSVPAVIDYVQRPSNPHNYPCYRCKDKHVSTMTRNTCKKVCERRKEFLRRHCTTRFAKEET